MTNKEAIKGLKALSKEFSGYKPNEEMFDMAIKALELVTINSDSNEIKVTNCNYKDTIYRQAAIDAVHEEFDDCLVWDESGKRTADEFETIINRLPSVQSEQTKMIKEIRKWINSGNRGSADYFIVDKIEEIINKYDE